MKNRILVLGGCGFVGSNLCHYFNERGYRVIAFDNLVRRGSETNLPEFKRAGIEFVHGDIRNPEDLWKLPPVDAVLECSAQPSATDGYNNPYYDLTNNTIGLINVLEFVRKCEIPMIFWSTNKVYCGTEINRIPKVEKKTRYEIHMGSMYPFGISEDFTINGGDHSIYGVSKACSDLLCQEYANAFNLPIVVNRWSCLAGPRQWGKCAQGWVAWWAIAALLELPIKYIGWKGKQVRDVLFAPDICRLVETELSMIKKLKGQVFNVGGGHKNTLSLIEATSMVERLTGRRMKTSVEPNPRKADHCVYISDISKVKRMTGWEPKVGLEDGYVEIIKWVRSNYDMLRRLYK